MSLAEVGPIVEIMGGTKKRHFANIQKRTGIAYKDMLFFVRAHLRSSAPGPSAPRVPRRLRGRCSLLRVTRASTPCML